MSPTIAALLGIPAGDGVDGRGRARSGVRLAMQDGDEITELDPDERPDHVVVFLWDGVNPNALHDAVDRGEAPGIASLIERAPPTDTAASRRCRPPHWPTTRHSAPVCSPDGRGYSTTPGSTGTGTSMSTCSTITR